MMRYITIVTLALLSSGALAQDVAPTPPPADAPKTETAAPTPPSPPPAPDKAYFEFDQADLATLAQAINELPKKQADPFLLKLQGQMQRQQQFKSQFEAATKEEVPLPKPRPNRK